MDHAYGMAMSTRAEAGGEGLHHEGGMFDHGCYYVTHGQRVHNGLLVVSLSLCDVPKGAVCGWPSAIATPNCMTVCAPC